MNSEWYTSTLIVATQALSNFAVYIPRILASLLILVIGATLAKGLRKAVVRLFETIRVSKAIKKTPIEHFLSNADLGTKLEDILGGVFYWLVMLVVIQTTVSVLGLESLSSLIQRIINYLPNVVSSVLVLFIGLLVAGLVESLVKGAIKSIDGHSSRVLGKISSYLVMSFTILIAISELGIAEEFILILFVGFVAMVSLGFGLALGLGGKDIVNTLLHSWYKKIKKQVKE